MALSSSPSVDTYETNERVLRHAVELLEKGSERGFIRFVDVLDSYKVVDGAKNTLLHWAAAYGCHKVVDYLLSLGLPVNARNAAQATPLHCAAASCTNPGTMIVTLAMRNADLNATNERGESVVSLLLSRGMAAEAAMCGALLTSLHDHPERYVLTAVPPPTLPCASVDKVMAHLGTSSLFTPVTTAASPPVLSNGGRSPPSVTFQHGRQRTPPSSRLSSARLQSSEYPPATSSAHRLWGGDEQPSASLNSVSGALWFDSSKASHCCDASWWLADNERSLLVAEEGRCRARVEIAYYEEHVSLLYHFFGMDTAEADVVDNIVAVLGEKFSPDDVRMLLVRWWVDEDEDGSSGEPRRVYVEDWVALDEIATSEKVQAYVARFDRTYSTVFSATTDRFGGDFNGVNDSGVALDESERQELERELGLIPSRRLSSGASSPNRTSLAGSQDAVNLSAATPLQAGGSSFSSSSGHRRSSAGHAFTPYVSAGARAARLYESERRQGDAIATTTAYSSSNVRPAAEPPLGADTGVCAEGRTPHNPLSTADGTVTASSHLTAFHEEAASPITGDDEHAVRDTTDASQHSFRSGTTLPPPVGDSTGGSITSTLNESAASPNVATVPGTPHTSVTPVAGSARQCVTRDPSAPCSSTDVTVPAASRRSPAVRDTATVATTGSASTTQKQAQFRLTESQKAAYDRFLFQTAMGMLKK